MVSISRLSPALTQLKIKRNQLQNQIFLVKRERTMKGQVNAWWLNALVITVTLFMWLSVVGSVAVGLSLAGADASTSEDHCNYEEC
jgi:hypothetical protein